MNPALISFKKVSSQRPSRWQAFPQIYEKQTMLCYSWEFQFDIFPVSLRFIVFANNSEKD